jgi:hypothetical protein
MDAGPGTMDSMADAARLPHALAPLEGPLPTFLCDGALASLGDRGEPVRALVDAGLVPPDVLTGVTLFLLANQPRRPRSGGKKKGAIEGGVTAPCASVRHSTSKASRRGASFAAAAATG